jgi:hypothetical protein
LIIKFNISNLRLLAVLLFSLLTLNPVFAGNVYNGVQILIGVVPEMQGMETKTDTLIYNILVFELEKYGLITEKIQFESNNSLELVLSSDSGIGLAVICSYTTIDTRVFLNIELYDSRTMLVLASATTSADFDLSFDKVITKVVSELIGLADEELTKRVVRFDFEDKSTEVEEDNIHEKTVPEIFVSEAKGGLELFLNTGTTMGVGESSNFMQVPGFCLELSTNYWFFTSIGFLGIGAQAAANLYPSTGQNTSTSLLLFPVGLSMAWSTTTDKLVSGIVQIGAGPSLAVLLFEGAEPLTKIVPYINSSLLLSFNFRKWMSLGIKTTYSIYFEDTGVLTTLTPSIYASFRSWN